MRILKSGEYLGQNLKTDVANGIFASLITYAEDDVEDHSRHVHVNPHLTFYLRGGTREKKGSVNYERKPGDIVFTHSGEVHHNEKTLPGSRNMNFEFGADFFQKYEVSELGLERVNDNEPWIRAILVKIFQEVVANKSFDSTSLDFLILQLLHNGTADHSGFQPPAWVKKVRECLHDRWDETVSLEELSQLADVHPTTISRYFPKYFSCTLGAYLRKLKIEKAITFISSSETPLSTISYRCGFADQSHFIRTFKETTGLLPKDFRKF